jgi:hypothetical protein
VCSTRLRPSIVPTEGQPTNPDLAETLKEIEVLLSLLPPSSHRFPFPTLQDDLNRRWITLDVAILRGACERRKALLEEGEGSPETVFSFPNPPPALPETLRFQSLEVPATPLATAEAITSFETAREVFLRAATRLEAAKRTFPLDGLSPSLHSPSPPLSVSDLFSSGFVTDHVQLVRQHALLFHSLSIFETDVKRKLAMQLRRVEMLRPFLDSLGRSAFEKLHKELAYELGEIFLSVFELKLSKISEKSPQAAQTPERFMKPSDLQKTNEYCLSAVAMFLHFLSFYSKETAPPGGGPSGIAKNGRDYGSMSADELLAVPPLLPSWGVPLLLLLFSPLSISLRPHRRRGGPPLSQRALPRGPHAVEGALLLLRAAPPPHPLHGPRFAPLPVAAPKQREGVRAEAGLSRGGVRTGAGAVQRDDRPAARQDRSHALPGRGRALRTDQLSA